MPLFVLVLMEYFKIKNIFFYLFTFCGNQFEIWTITKKKIYLLGDKESYMKNNPNWEKFINNTNSLLFEEKT